MIKKFILTVALACAFPGLVKAETAYTEGGTFTNVAGQGLTGFNFTVTTPISVTDLGFWGQSLGGGDTPWSALYNVDTATLLGSVSWAGGEALAGWNYKPLDTPIVLTPGITYQAVGTLWWTQQYDNTASFTYGTGINPIGFTSSTGFGGWGTPVMATSSLTTTPDIVANFQYTVVPEPSTYALILAVGCVGLVVLRRCKMARSGS